MIESVFPLSLHCVSQWFPNYLISPSPIVIKSQILTPNFYSNTSPPPSPIVSPPIV